LSSEAKACREVANRMTDYLEGILPPADRQRFESHCQACPACRADLEQMRAIVESLGRSAGRRETAGGPEKERLLGLFRDYGLHRQGHRRRPIPLGLGESAVAPGDHIAYFYESEQEYQAAAGFLAAGVGQQEICIILGHDDANERMAAGFKRTGLDVAALRHEGRLHLVSGKRSADALLEEIGDRVKSAVQRGEPLVRILGSLGWGRPDWPRDRDLLYLEARVTDAIRNLPTVVMCTYDVRQVAGRNLLLGGLECHPLTIRRDALRTNPHYVPAEPFLAALDSKLT
jgi:DcmR-like sensory protein/putative zinc finger protein